MGSAAGGVGWLFVWRIAARHFGFARAGAVVWDDESTVYQLQFQLFLEDDAVYFDNFGVGAGFAGGDEEAVGRAGGVGCAVYSRRAGVVTAVHGIVDNDG